jgi:hypothetical protein
LLCAALAVLGGCSSSSSDGSTNGALDAPSTLTCSGRTLQRGPAAPDLDALCLGKPDCTAVRDELISGCPNTLFCTCGSGVCYDTTSSAVGCGDAGAQQQCGDRLCGAGEYCAITTHATAPADGGSRAEFRCAPLPTCGSASICDCLVAGKPDCTCAMAFGGATSDPYVTCSAR